MGCDIHVWIEKRQADGLWKLHASLENMSPDVDNSWDEHWNWVKKHYPHTEDRNYKRFGALAGVRTGGPLEKGWPADRDPVLENYAPGIDPDLHSHSWYPLREAAQIWADTEWPDWVDGGLYRANPMAMYFNVNPEVENPDDYRVLFAFDN